MAVKRIPILVAMVGFFTLLTALGFHSTHEEDAIIIQARRKREVTENRPRSDEADDEPDSNIVRTYLAHSTVRLPECFQPPINESYSSVFNATICFDTSTCQGQVSVTVADCLSNSPSIISNDPSHSNVLKQLGPDTVRARVVGPEIHAGLAVAIGRCTYAYPLSFERSGLYNVALERLYANYDGVNEAFGAWPQLLKQSVFPVDAPPSNYHFQQRTLESTVDLKCTRNAVPTVEKRIPCTGFETDNTGRWVVQVPSANVMTRVRVKKIKRNPIVFEWALASEPATVWKPSTCSVLRDPSLLTIFFNLFKGKRVVVAGDSQLRALYFGLVNVLNGEGERCARNITTLASEPLICIQNVKGSHRKRFKETQVDFFDDLFLDKFSSSAKYDGYDVLIIGFAQHPASREHWPFSRYKASTDQKASKVSRLIANGKQVVWYLAPQYPHTTNGYPVAVRDWRTDARLKIFNDYSESRMRDVKAAIVDSYKISTAMSHTSPDQAHFSNFVSYEIVHLLMTVLVGRG